MESKSQNPRIGVLKVLPSASDVYDFREAMKLLQKLSVEIGPIMESMNWRIERLEEFRPKNPSLLGMNINQGKKVLICLRYARGNDAFLSLSSLVHTAIHELVHNRYSEHSAAFYDMMYKLLAEYNGDRSFNVSQRVVEPMTIKPFGGEGVVLGRMKSVAGGECTSDTVYVNSPRAKACLAAIRRRQAKQVLNMDRTDNKAQLESEYAVPKDRKRSRGLVECAAKVNSVHRYRRKFEFSSRDSSPNNRSSSSLPINVEAKLYPVKSKSRSVDVVDLTSP